MSGYFGFKLRLGINVCMHGCLSCVSLCSLIKENYFTPKVCIVMKTKCYVQRQAILLGSRKRAVIPIPSKTRHLPPSNQTPEGVTGFDHLVSHLHKTESDQRLN